MAFSPAAIIFDMDGLLFDSEALSHKAMLAAAREMEIDFGTPDFLQLVGRPWAINRLFLQEKLGSEAAVDAFRATWTRHAAVLLPGLALKPGVKELLAHLEARGLPRAICTSSGHATVQRNLAMHGLEGRFDAVIAAGDYARGKPAPDPFLRAAEVLGLPPAACLVLEDSHNGIRAAAAAGTPVIMVPDLLPATEEIRALCHSVEADLHAVRALLG